MKVRITKIEKFHKSQVSTMEVGDSVVGDIESLASISVGHPILLKDAYYEKTPKKIYGSLLLVNKVIEVKNDGFFKTDYASYKIV